MDSTQVTEILDFICDHLGGDWFLTGGALVRLYFDETRGTEDVDLVKLQHPSLSDEAAKNKLFRWLIDRGLGPEWVNSAVEPFVQEVPTWKKETVLIRSGSKGNIYRPSLTLFVYLKLRRGTEIDVLDIKKAIPHCKERFDENKFLKWANEKVKKKFLENRSALGL